MQKFDAFFARLVKFVETNREYVLWVTTSMGQEATEAKALETQLYLVDGKKFTAALGLAPEDWEVRPAMLPQWNVFVRPHKVAAFRDALNTVRIDGNPLGFREAQGGFFSLDFGHPNLYEKTGDVVRVAGRSVSPDEVGLKNVEIEDKSNATAYHIPQGSLLVYDADHRDPKQNGRRPQVSTREIAPTILHNYSVATPPYMVKPVKIGA